MPLFALVQDMVAYVAVVPFKAITPPVRASIRSAPALTKYEYIVFFYSSSLLATTAAATTARVPAVSLVNVHPTSSPATSPPALSNARAQRPTPLILGPERDPGTDP